MRALLVLLTVLTARCVCLPPLEQVRTACSATETCVAGRVCCAGRCVVECIDDGGGGDTGAPDGGCAGCIALQVCVTGTADEACGRGGGACDSCSTTEQCHLGQCVARGSGGTGGQVGAGGAGGALVDAGPPGERCENPERVMVTGPTMLRGLTSPARGSLSCGMGQNTPRRFYAVSVDQRAELSFTPTAGYSGAMAIHNRQCGDVPDEFECAVTPVPLRAIFTAGRTIYLSLESAAGGMAEVDVSMRPLAPGSDCGNSLVMPATGTGFLSTGTLVSPRLELPTGCARTNDGGLVYLRFPTILGDQYEVTTNGIAFGANSADFCDGTSTCRTTATFTASTGIMRLVLVGALGLNYMVTVTRTPRPLGDNCFNPFVVDAGASVNDLTMYRSDYGSTCGPNSGLRDAVFRIPVTEPSRVRVTPTPGTFVSLRASCTVPNEVCVPNSLNANRPVSVVAFGSSAVGLSSVSVTPLAAETCATAEPLTLGQTVTDSFAEAFADNHDSGCGGATGPDLVYRFVAPNRFNVRFTSDGGGQVVLQKNGCSNSYAQQACLALDAGMAVLNEPNGDGGVYYLWVEGQSAASFSLRVEPY
jgi:hypothetical protein